MCLAEKVRLEGGPFAIAHCNFRLRGADSDADEALVRSWAASHGITCHVKHFDTQAFAASEGISIEMAARRLRYHWFGQLCREHGYSGVAVAHNANDNAETLILNLLRGTGLRGLIGMKASGFIPDPDFADIPLLRPLLGMTRDDIVAFAAENGLSWREDATNALNDYKRNKIRNLVFPIFKEINPSFVKVLNRNMQLFSEQLKNLNPSLDQRVGRGVDRGVDPEGNPGVSRGVDQVQGGSQQHQNTVDLVQGNSGRGPISGGGPGPALVPLSGLEATLGGPGPAHKIGPRPKTTQTSTNNEVDQVQGKPCQHQNTVDLVQGEPCQYQNTVDQVQGKPYQYQNTVDQVHHPLCVVGENGIISFSEELWDGTQPVRQAPGTLILDADKLSPEACESLLLDGLSSKHIGPWESGDWIKPLGAPGRKTMQDWFTDHHISADEKPFVPLLRDSADRHHILAVIPYCIDNSVRVTKKTRRILRVK